MNTINNDAKKGHTSIQKPLERRDFYTWKSVSHQPLARGLAVVFHDNEVKLAENLKTPLDKLGYTTSTHKLEAQMSFSDYCGLEKVYKVN